jgi:hypothetical protein
VRAIQGGAARCSFVFRMAKPAARAGPRSYGWRAMTEDASELDEAFDAVDTLHESFEWYEDDPRADGALARLAVIEKYLARLNPCGADVWAGHPAPEPRPSPEDDMEQALAALSALEAAYERVRVKRRNLVEAITLSAVLAYILTSFTLIGSRDELPVHVPFPLVFSLAVLSLALVIFPIARRIVAWME